MTLLRTPAPGHSATGDEPPGSATGRLQAMREFLGLERRGARVGASMKRESVRDRSDPRRRCPAGSARFLHQVLGPVPRGAVQAAIRARIRLCSGNHSLPAGRDTWIRDHPRTRGPRPCAPRRSAVGGFAILPSRRSRRSAPGPGGRGNAGLAPLQGWRMPTPRKVSAQRRPRIAPGPCYCGRDP